MCSRRGLLCGFWNISLIWASFGDLRKKKSRVRQRFGNEWHFFHRGDRRSDGTHLSEDARPAQLFRCAAHHPYYRCGQFLVGMLLSDRVLMRRRVISVSHVGRAISCRVLMRHRCHRSIPSRISRAYAR